jgi:hypothetical protein
MQAKLFTCAAGLAAALLWPAGGAEAGELSGSISLGKTKTKSETTVTVSPGGGTVTSTTRTETRGGAFDISFGRDRRHHYGSRYPDPRDRWGGRRGPYAPPYYGPTPYGTTPPPYYGPAPYPPYPVYTPPPGPYSGVYLSVPTQRTEVRREVIIIQPSGPVAAPSRP